MKLLFLNIIVVRRHLHCKSYRLSPWYIYIYMVIICYIRQKYHTNRLLGNLDFAFDFTLLIKKYT
ncbi:BEM_collapsed_G0053750.mRNA.1.CDS.1 [Saccharomyces cerevisiae]|nr:AMP_1a_G0051810.mRNA.1.CDS.1 [Saccharomyces cerevisiae]CAI4803891.1 ABA_G0052300.mRNA.1.CDS.1 [Saccharomyces cerevisiae]CAI4938117.1 BEM_HP_G0135870.mRNA.1.CDS.1 [Saccharomyces cerevisiae]CAI5016740.1 BEM_HP_G0025670.mRNA.1.CDS.1 [Saccharomyces cerevisiae]CAI5206335.1 BEM_HP_G0107920.mRNA.1.CDS.1 [Saccharomyces cerevisiae]